MTMHHVSLNIILLPIAAPQTIAYNYRFLSRGGQKLVENFLIQSKSLL